MTQPTTKRLLTEANAAAGYLHKASPAATWAPRKIRARLAAMATPPTVTKNSSSKQLTGSTLVPYSDSRIVYRGGNMDAFSGNSHYGAPRDIASVEGIQNTPFGGLSVNFSFYGQVFEIESLDSGGGMYRLWVNGQPATDLWQNLDSQFYKIDLGSRSTWEIRVEYFHGYFAGINVLPTDALFAPRTLLPLRVCLIGDSFAWGQSWEGGSAPSGSTTYRPGYVPRLGELLQIDDIRGAGIGGTGYLADAGKGAPTFRGRFAQDIAPYTPDVLVIQGSINDATNGFTPTAVAAEIATFYTAIKAALPNVLIIATSPLQAQAKDTPTQTMSDAQKAAWTTVGVPFIDLMGMNTGTGNFYATTGDGTADFVRSGDGTHPMWPGGYDYIAERLAAGIGPILRAAN